MAPERAAIHSEASPYRVKNGKFLCCCGTNKGTWEIHLSLIYFYFYPLMTNFFLVTPLTTSVKSPVLHSFAEEFELLRSCGLFAVIGADGVLPSDRGPAVWFAPEVTDCVQTNPNEPQQGGKRSGSTTVNMAGQDPS